MNNQELISDFENYLLVERNYSPYTVTNYLKDINDYQDSYHLNNGNLVVSSKTEYCSLLSSIFDRFKIF